MCQAPGKGTLPMARGERTTAQRHDTRRRVGDAGERAGYETNTAAQLVPPSGVNTSGTFSSVRVTWIFPMNAPARIVELERQLHWAQLEIQALREELRQRRIQQLGPKSETLTWWRESLPRLAR